MATAKKKTATKKSTSKKTPASKAKKPAAKKPAAHKKAGTKATSIPSGREEKLASQALELVDKASAILRERIRTGAQQTAKTRLAAKRQAHSLLGRASTNLTKALDAGTSSLQNLIKKI